MSVAAILHQRTLSSTDRAHKRIQKLYTKQQTLGNPDPTDTSVTASVSCGSWSIAQEGYGKMISTIPGSLI